jgi:diguanylate cyclase
MSPFSDFESAARAVLKTLHERIGFDLWMVSRIEGNDWIVLQSEGPGYGIQPGNVFHFADSFCSQMILGRGPRVAPVTAEIPAYHNSPANQLVSIGAYIGVPLSREDGSLFGTLCAIHPTPQSPLIEAELPLIELLAKLLSTILQTDLKAADSDRKADLARADAMTDALTGLSNRRGWDHLVAAEESRCRRYGHHACILSIDLDGLKRINDTLGHARGDELICRAGAAIAGATREQDIVARLGGDEFAVLGIECDRPGAEALKMRIFESLERVGVEASIGVAHRDPSRGLLAAVEEADKAMYDTKSARRRLRPEMARV